MRVLIIDDSRAMRAILSKIMSKIGFDTTTAGDGKEGLETLAVMERPELIMVDWNLPTMNGFEFVQAVRSQAEYDDIRMMMVTTETEIENVTKALDAGVDEYIMKPFTEATIIEKLSMLGIEVQA